MLKTHHQFFRLLFQISDSMFVISSWFFAYFVRFYAPPNFLPTTDPINISQYLPFALVIGFVWYLSLQISGAYKSWRTEKLGAEIFCIVKASLLGFVTLVTITHFFAREVFSRAAFLIFLAFAITFLIVNRWILRRTLQYLRKKGWNHKNVLLIGYPDFLKGISQKIKGRPELGLTPKGYIAIGEGKLDLTLYESIHKLEEIVKSQGIDQIIVSVRNQDAKLIDEILGSLIDLNVGISVIPDVSQYSILGFNVEEFDGLPILSLNQSPIVGWNAVLKRISDFFIALIAIIIFSPIMILISLLIKLTSKGPLFYKQERMGLDGKEFYMYKFRSMKLNAESDTGAVWAAQNDDRTSSIGRLIRKTSLDELPQLLNVLRGDMSLVGPRPERPIFVEKFKKEIPGYMLRHKVKAGMTGWAQINGFRGNTSLEGRIEYDLYYITHWSLSFDIRILFMTIFKGFISSNAY